MTERFDKLLALDSIRKKYSERHFLQDENEAHRAPLSPLAVQWRHCKTPK